MGDFIDPEDLAPFADIPTDKAEAMIADVEGRAVLVAPCIIDLITEPDDETDADRAARLAKLAAVKSVLRGAILRWHDAGSGAVTQTQVGPFGQMLDTRQPRRTMFWPSEIEDLQAVCSGGGDEKAFSVDTVPTRGFGHAPYCNVMFPGGADNGCSCGAVLTAGNGPLWE